MSIDPAARFKVKVVAELRKLIQCIEPDIHSAVSGDLLELLTAEADLHARIARTESRTPLQAARQTIRDTATAWKKSGKLARLSDTDPAVHDLYKRLFQFSENERANRTQEEFWAQLER